MWPFSNKKYRELQEKVDYLTGQLVIVRLDKDEDVKRVNKLIVDLDKRACAFHKRIVDLEERASSLDESASDLDAHIGATSNTLTKHIATSVNRMNEISNYQSDHITGPSHLTSEEASGLKRLLEGERVVDSTIEDLVATDQATDQDLKELAKNVTAITLRLVDLETDQEEVARLKATRESNWKRFLETEARVLKMEQDPNIVLGRVLEGRLADQGVKIDSHSEAIQYLTREVHDQVERSLEPTRKSKAMRRLKTKLILLWGAGLT